MNNQSKRVNFSLYGRPVTLIDIFPIAISILIVCEIINLGITGLILGALTGLGARHLLLEYFDYKFRNTKQKYDKKESKEAQE